MTQRAAYEFQSPRGDFGFLKHERLTDVPFERQLAFQSPRGDFGFLKKQHTDRMTTYGTSTEFQSPRGDFGFLKV